MQNALILLLHPMMQSIMLSAAPYLMSYKGAELMRSLLSPCPSYRSPIPPTSPSFWSSESQGALTVMCFACRSARAITVEDLQPLLAALEVPALSRTVQQSVPQLQGFSGSQELDPIIADCVLAVQRYLLHRHPEVNHALDSSVTSRLLNLRCVFCFVY